MQEKARLTVAFLKIKEQDYERLQNEIAYLKAEVLALEHARRASGTHE
jgi:hypothetical protein